MSADSATRRAAPITSKDRALRPKVVLNVHDPPYRAAGRRRRSPAHRLCGRPALRRRGLPGPAASQAPPEHPPAASASAHPGLPPLPPGLPAQIEHGPRNRPEVALTFHGRGEPAIATALLTEAEQAGARLTVLAVGEWLDQYPQLARRILDGGHELGNHTQTHGNICAMGAAAATAEITGCADRLRKLTGSPGRWFRPSQARLATPLVERLARQAGYEHVLAYDVDSSTSPNPEPGPSGPRWPRTSAPDPW